MKPLIKRTAVLPLATTLLCMLALASCKSVPSPPGHTPPDHGPKPEGAYNEADQPLPPGFSAFAGSEAEWNQASAEGRLIPYTPEQNRSAEATAKAQDEAARTTISAYEQAHPEVAARIAALIATPDLKSPSSRAVNLRLEGDLYLHDIKQNDGVVRTFGLLGDSYVRQIVAGSLSAFSADRELASTHAIYAHLYDLMSKDPRFNDQFRKSFRPPAEIARLDSIREVKAAINRFKDVLRFRPITQRIDPRPSPENEIGYGDGGDRHTNSCTTASAKGVIGSSYMFPLKYDLTSVKDQASRGSCVAFGVNAALESAWARDSHQYINISEQDLYYHMKGYWWPVGDAYGDGSDQHAVFDMMASLGDGYYVPYEKQWDYNPSLSRTQDPEDCGTPGQPACQRKYTHSCDDYSESCSNTNHQGGAFCLASRFWHFCAYFSPVSATSQQVRAKSDGELWNLADVDGSLGWAIIASWLKSPIVIGIAVPPSFDNAADGYVTYAGSKEKSRGGHAVEVVGWIDDAKLPAGAPKAGHDGGGGYLIIKNSWGTCAGDIGYYYLPYQWVKDYAYSMVVLNGVEHK